jgi:UDP:flavonoid glycosyltransferase YjiC (YdhE family)
VLVERFVPQRALLPRAAAVVSHAGSGTVVSALACGVPLVLLPMGADQPWNADRCEALGVGRVLDPLTVSPAEAAAAVDDVLTVPGYRMAAGVLQKEAASLPPAESAADALEELGRRTP